MIAHWLNLGYAKVAVANWLRELKADFHSVQFRERAKFCDRFLLKCVLSCRTNFITVDMAGCTHFKSDHMEGKITKM